MAVSEAATRSEEIFHGADSHSLNAQSMVEAIEEIAKVAGDNGMSVAGLDETMRREVETMMKIFATAEAVTRLARELDGSLNYFRTSGAGTEDDAAQGAHRLAGAQS
jgi:methyl-accepting chemotaxis protein